MDKLRLNEFDEGFSFDGDLVRWQDKPFTGIVYDLWPNGRLASEVEYVNGREEGLTRGWYASGQLRNETLWWRGAGHGLGREWFENGQLKREAIHEYGILVKERIWDEAGKLVRDFEISERDQYFSHLQRRRQIYKDKGPTLT